MSRSPYSILNKYLEYCNDLPDEGAYIQRSSSRAKRKRNSSKGGEKVFLMNKRPCKTRCIPTFPGKQLKAYAKEEHPDVSLGKIADCTGGAVSGAHNALTQAGISLKKEPVSFDLDK